MEQNRTQRFGPKIKHLITTTPCIYTVYSYMELLFIERWYNTVVKSASFGARFIHSFNAIN